MIPGRVEDVTKDRALGRTAVRAGRGASSPEEPGELVTVAGSSGPGKSTLPNRTGCLDHPATAPRVVRRAGGRTAA